MDDGDSPDRLVGEVLGGRFRVLKLLGQGGMGAVLAAEDQASGRKVALKLMRPSLADDERLIARFEREARVLAAIDHPAVVGVAEAGALPDGTLFIAMELLEGETLKQLLRSRRQVPIELVLPIVRGLAGALTAAHQAGVVHRDLKPSNIFLPNRPDISLSTPEGAQFVKLVDFGVAKIYDGSKLTLTGGLVGTYRYTAPEQLLGLEVDGRADIYSLGVVMYEMLAGEPPFPTGAFDGVVQAILKGQYRPLRELVPGIDPRIEAVVGKAMATSREARFATAEELADAFVRAYMERSLGLKVIDPQMSRRPTLRDRRDIVDGDARTLTDPERDEERAGGAPNEVADEARAVASNAETLSRTESEVVLPMRHPRIGRTLVLVALVLLAIAGAFVAYR